MNLCYRSVLLVFALSCGGATLSGAGEASSTSVGTDVPWTDFAIASSSAGANWQEPALAGPLLAYATAPSAIERQRTGIQLVQGDTETFGNPSLAPLKWGGLLVVKTGDGKLGRCTAQFIAPQVILTAGHCFKDLEQNAFATDVAFLLQYQNKTWAHRYGWQCGSVPARYSLPEDYKNHNDEQKKSDELTAAQYDYAMILVDSPSTTGYFQNWAGSWKPGQWHGATKVGYPGEVTSGEVIQKAHGALIFADDIGGETELPRLLALWQFNPHLTQGISGGAWIGNFDPQEGKDSNVVLSVSSFFPESHPEMTFGPQFDRDEFRTLLDHVASGGCGAQQPSGSPPRPGR
jgi:hypothetical protein